MNAAPATPDGAPGLSLIVRRTIRATPERLFAAWTRPEQLLAWWGPAGVTCGGAEVDLRPGGTYRIDNVLPNGDVIVITGAFEQIDPPRRLVYSWQLGANDPAAQRVTVRFEPRGDATEVIIVHERLPTPAARDGHLAGWEGCLDGLTAFVADPAA